MPTRTTPEGAGTAVCPYCEGYPPNLWCSTCDGTRVVARTLRDETLAFWARFDPAPAKPKGGASGPGDT